MRGLGDGALYKCTFYLTLPYSRRSRVGGWAWEGYRVSLLEIEYGEKIVGISRDQLTII